mmetsp:Transcript_25461/g.75645  ORF Transcript_25461/g.75645 Transcript_25461/m.75645 type:complete len:245 (-) Transcript_25461:258-992(-)
MKSTSEKRAAEKSAPVASDRSNSEREMVAERKEALTREASMRATSSRRTWSKRMRSSCAPRKSTAAKVAPASIVDGERRIPSSSEWEKVAFARTEARSERRGSTHLSKEAPVRSAPSKRTPDESWMLLRVAPLRLASRKSESVSEPTTPPPPSCAAASEAWVKSARSKRAPVAATRVRLAPTNEALRATARWSVAPSSVAQSSTASDRSMPSRLAPVRLAPRKSRPDSAAHPPAANCACGPTRR